MIAFWMPDFQPTGLQTSTIRIAHALAQQGVAVDLVVSCNKGALSSLVKEPVRIVDLGLSESRLGRGLPKALRYVLRERPDAMFGCSGSGHLLAALAWLVRARTQIWIWELSTQGYRDVARKIEAGRRKLPQRLWRSLVRNLYELATKYSTSFVSGMVTNSKAVAKEIKDTFAEHQAKVHTIYNACLSSMDSDGDRDATGDSASTPVVISVGWLAERKELDVLLRAFRILRDQRPARLVFIGDGPARKTLEALAADLGLAADVEFAGFKIKPFAHCPRVDLFVLSSREEPFGNVLVEAMAHGIPVVSTDSSGPQEILEGGRYGPLVPVGDHAALAQAMAAILDHPPAAADLRRRAMDFHADRIASQYLEVLGLVRAPFQGMTV